MDKAIPSGTVSCTSRDAVAIFGALIIGRLLLRQLFYFVRGFRAFFLAPMGIGRLNLKKYGSWAVVTGASEGIGRGYALELARRGMNVVLMSRSEDKLNKVATEIKEKYGRDTRVIPVDFTGGHEIYAPLADQLNSLDIGILVNNVGTPGHVPTYFGMVEPEILYNVTQINSQAIVQMSRIVIPKMVARGGGIIVNLSSILSYTMLPLNILYCATKVFDTSISDGLRKEYSGKGIIVQNVTPAIVATPMASKLGDIHKPNLFVAEPIAFTRAAVATIGIQDDTHGSFNHAMQGYLVRNVLDFLLRMSSLLAGRNGKAKNN